MGLEYTYEHAGRKNITRKPWNPRGSHYMYQHTRYEVTRTINTATPLVAAGFTSEMIPVE